MGNEMAKSWTKTEAFAFFGTKLVNTVWSWSARSDDGKTVVLTLWSDRFSRGSSPVTYDGRKRFVGEDWKERSGNKERCANLKWAQQYCDSLFKVVMITPRHPTASPREILEAFPKPEMTMKITWLDPETGEFLAELVSPQAASPGTASS
jgi:hypothetical protein